jgi:AraC-like DNA-binding protein
MEVYDPIGYAPYKDASKVLVDEGTPPENLVQIVHRFLEKKTKSPLPEEYVYHALPDTCVYIVLDQRNVDIVGVSRLNAASCEFRLGHEFNFLVIRLYPGVWQKMDEVIHGQVYKPYEGNLPLVDVNRRLIGRSFVEKQEILSEFLTDLKQQGIVTKNDVTWRLISNLDKIKSVQDMADVSNKSSRQLQRILKYSTGLSPHDFLKVLRAQQTFKGHPLDYYADQAHYTRSLRSMTGYTPRSFQNKFDV